MPAVPAHLQSRIVSGMRWTLWLSVFAAPFSYGTAVLLARVGPQVIGTFGLLAVYTGVVTCLFYLGGDAVSIKFIPQLSHDRRASFLASYFVILLLGLIPWLTLAGLWPQALRYLFGEQDLSFRFLLLCLSPLCLANALVAAALKAQLEMRWAQLMARTVTIGSFLIYAVLFVGLRQLLASHYSILVWAVYLGLVALALCVGFLHLMRLSRWEFGWHSLRFFLPEGFWKYTLTTEAVSALSFLLQKLDMILVLNFGGLAVLGKYVAVTGLAALISVGSNFFLDTLLPSLTNLLASRNYCAASQIYSISLRTVFLVTMFGTSALIFLVKPIIIFLGPQYTSLNPVFVLAILLYGLSAPGALGGTLLSSVGKQHRSAIVGVVQLLLFLLLFCALWPKHQLAGAVLSTGISLVVSNLLLIQVARYRNDVKFSFARDYSALALALASAALLHLRLNELGLIYSLLAWPVVVLLFCILAGYSVKEYRRLFACFLPARFFP